MEQNQTQPLQQNIQQSKNKWLKSFLYLIGSLLLAGAVGYGVYIWQQDKSDKEALVLHQRIETLETTITHTDDTRVDNEVPKETVYKSKVGGLILTLPSEYGVIVKADGNKGGAPGAELHFGTIQADGVLENHWADPVQLDIDHYSNLQSQIQIVSNQLSEKKFENIKIQDGTINGKSAKVITGEMGADAFSARIYIVQSGEFTYRFTYKGPTSDTSYESDKFKAVLNGTEIVEAKLN